MLSGPIPNIPMLSTCNIADTQLCSALKPLDSDPCQPIPVCGAVPEPQPPATDNEASVKDYPSMAGFDASYRSFLVSSRSQTTTDQESSQQAQDQKACLSFKQEYAQQQVDARLGLVGLNANYYGNMTATGSVILYFRNLGDQVIPQWSSYRDSGETDDFDDLISALMVAGTFGYMQVLGDVQLQGNALNMSVLSIHAGACAVSGQVSGNFTWSNVGDFESIADYQALGIDQTYLLLGGNGTLQMKMANLTGQFSLDGIITGQDTFFTTQACFSSLATVIQPIETIVIIAFAAGLVVLGLGVILYRQYARSVAVNHQFTKISSSRNALTRSL